MRASVEWVNGQFCAPLMDIAALKRKWPAARMPGEPLPFYEEVVLGSLDRIADRLLLVAGDTMGTDFARFSPAATVSAAYGAIPRASSRALAPTAEEVETREQLSRLRAEGCTEVQGFLFSPPRPAAALGDLLREGEMKSRSAA